MRPQGVGIDRVLSRSVMIGSETRVLPVISLFLLSHTCQPSTSLYDCSAAGMKSRAHLSMECPVLRHGEIEYMANVL